MIMRNTACQARASETHLSRLLKRSLSAETHTVFNQSKPLVDIDCLKSDPGLLQSLTAFKHVGNDIISSFGLSCGSSSLINAAELAEKNKPTLKQFDNYGRRIDVAEYHSAYHQLMEHGISAGAAGYGFRVGVPGSQVTRAALVYMENQVEPGHCCPIVMTAAAIPVMLSASSAHEESTLSVGSTTDKSIFKECLQKLCSEVYDPRDVPISEKAGITIGMSMTEKQGGSDVRANRTTATQLSSGNEVEYELNGHKWFTSAPMCDAFLTLAQVPSQDDNSKSSNAPTCFLVPRWKPDGTRNSGFQVMRLKNKLGDLANASSEVEYRDAYAIRVGPIGRGVRTIIDMVQSTRLDCTLGSAAAARKAVQVAINHTVGRSAFGQTLITHPLMRNVLADLCVESEAHTLTAMYMARSFDRHYNRDITEQEHFPVNNSAVMRAGVSVAKYFVTKRLPGFTYECMEVMGGNGYVEDFPMARLFRQSPLNSIWEGSGNVIALDILRAHKELPALIQDISCCKGSDRRLDAYLEALTHSVEVVLKDPMSLQAQRGARNIVDRLAVAMIASVQLRFGDPQMAEAYIATRVPALSNVDAQHRGVNIGGDFIYGNAQSDYIIERNLPHFV